MNKEHSRQLDAALNVKRSDNSILSRCVRLGLVSTLGATLALSQTDVPVAQQRLREPGVKVKQIAASGSVVSITADGSMNRAQTWQDGEGFHVVLVNGATDLGGSGSPRGVKLRPVGNSLEMVIPVKAGATVTVRPKGNRLDLVVEGEGFAGAQVGGEREEQASSATPVSSARQPRARAPQGEGGRVAPFTSKRHPGEEATANETARQQTSLKQSSLPASQPPVARGAEPQVGVESNQPPAASTDEPASAQNGAAQSSNVQSAAGELRVEEGASLGALIFSLPSLLVLLGVSGFGALLVVLRRRRASADDEVEGETKEDEALAKFEQPRGDRRRSSISVPFERRKQGRGAEDEATRQQSALSGSNGSEGGESRGASTALPAVLFGSYRIDQEVIRLIHGEPHSIEVLSSRASEDRRAVETSLLKALRAPETDEDGRRRARTALEDYGFVARESAALLLSSESFERATAARTLGEIKSSQALPFLTEALYDSDAVVRTEVVQSLGSLGLPSAIGALLDIARRHPELPATILGPALTACSVESLELQWDSPEASRTFADFGGEETFTGEIRMLQPIAEVEQLPDWLEDETLLNALERLESAEVEARVLAAQTLAQFQVRRAVEALSMIAMHDTEGAVRAAALNSLALINHESVFVPVLVAMADDAREVRAASARALSRLSFDRADAYVRVIEHADGETLGEVARACVKSGLVAQAINRLASQDRRQAYEAFSLLSLAVKAGEAEPLLDAIECHRDIEVRLAAVRLLGLMYEPELASKLQRIGENGGVPEKVRVAIREAMQRASASLPVSAE
jgi:HEAT repeat protein